MNTYNRVSEEFIKSKLNTKYYTLLSDCCYNLSAILGDIDGYIPGSIAKQLSLVLITFPGLVSGGNTESVQVGILPEERFYSDISSEAYNLYLDCVNSNTKRILPGASENYSKLMSLSAELSPKAKSAICSVYLESFAVYLDLLNIDVTVKNITRGDITRICNNIEWIDSKLENVDSTSYSLMQTLRDLERTLAYIGSLKEIFVKTINEQFSDYNKWVEGIRYE